MTGIAGDTRLRSWESNLTMLLKAKEQHSPFFPPLLLSTLFSSVLLCSAPRQLTLLQAKSRRTADNRVARAEKAEIAHLSCK